MPVKFSSLLLILSGIGILLNLLFIKNSFRNRLKSYFLFISPFLLYYVSIIYSFLVDLYEGFTDFEFIQRNVSILIIPSFIFFSDFSKVTIIKILKKSAVIISFIGFYFLISWIFGYVTYNNQNEIQKNTWFKNELIFKQVGFLRTNEFEFEIKENSFKPSIRKVLMFDSSIDNDSVYRQFEIENVNNSKNVWLLLRTINDDTCKVWFNLSKGELGDVEGDVNFFFEKKKNNYKITFSNIIKDKSNREWFYISFVQANGSYTFKNNFETIKLKIKNPKASLKSGIDLLKKKNLFQFNLKEFSYLKEYGHGTYLGLVFLISFIILLNVLKNNSLKYLLLFLNFAIVILLASKAIFISFVLLIFYYFFKHNKKLIVLLLFLITLICVTENHFSNRINDLYYTFVKVVNNNELGDLKELSTNNRYINYQQYLELISEKPLKGYGFQNAINLNEEKYNKQLNAHNQFLQSIFNSGFLGIISFLFLCASPFLIDRKDSKKILYLKLIILMILFNFLFESILFRQWGLILVSFIFSIYFQYYSLKIKWFQ